MDYCPYRTRVIGSIVFCYILHEFFLGIIALHMEVLVFFLFYTPLQLPVINLHWFSIINKSEEIMSAFMHCTILKKRNLFHYRLSFWMILAGRPLGSDERCSL
jgi:hypothetical protein